MDIVKEDVDNILGIPAGKNDTSESKPLNEFRQGLLKSYIKRRETAESPWLNIQGDAVILVNKRLVFLGKGAGFGELALMQN